MTEPRGQSPTFDLVEAFKRKTDQTRPTPPFCRGQPEVPRTPTPRSMDQS